LENAAQPRAPALRDGNDGQPVALVIRPGLGANLRPRDGGFCQRGASRILRRYGQTERGANAQRHGAKHSSFKQFEFGFHKLLMRLSTPALASHAVPRVISCHPVQQEKQAKVTLDLEESVGAFRKEQGMPSQGSSA
jgi:hypothetical protein